MPELQLFSSCGLRCSEIIGKEGQIFYIDLVTDPKMNKEGETMLLCRGADTAVLARMAFTFCTPDPEGNFALPLSSGLKPKHPAPSGQ